LTGRDFEISATLGSTRGANLFHSFQTFSIDTGESATFTGPGSIDNVISRVTGGEVSSIDGLLRSEVGTADFYFINPAGVMFGPNAQVDVPAAFHVSTADELRFQDGAVFSASAPDSSALSVASPESFGFLSPQPASLTVNGSQLEFAPASRVTMVANDVTVQNGASLNNESGAIRVTAVGESETTVDVASGSTDSTVDGAIEIRGSSALNASGTLGTETVELRGGAIEVEDSLIAADNSGAEDGVGRVLLEADSISVINGGVRTRISGTGQGNDILLVADRVSLMNGGQLSSIVESGASGSGGGVEIQAPDAVTIEGVNSEGYYSGIYTTSYSEGDADGGSIFVDAPQALITIDDGGIIQTGTAGAGDAGSVTIDANDLLILDDSAIWTFTQGSGDGGNVTIKANQSITMDNAEIDSGTSDVGTAGQILLTASGLSLLNNSEIMADTISSGAAGNINVEVSGPITLMDSSAIEAATDGVGPAGQVMLKSGDLSLINRSAIGALTLSIGTGGYLTIDVENTFLLESDSFLTCGISGDGEGTAGDIRVIAEKLEILNGGLITNRTIGNEDAGAIVVDATDILIDGGGVQTGIISDTDSGSGAGGNIQVTATGRLEIVNGGLISSITRGEGVGGNVVVTANELLIRGGGDDQPSFTGLFGDARMSSGGAGNIYVTAEERLEIANGGVISTSTISGEGDAGVVSVEAVELVIDGEGQFMDTGIFSESIFSSGNANEVQVIATDRLDIRQGGEISSSTGGGEGIAGNVSIVAPELIIDGQGTGSDKLSDSVVVSGRTGVFSGATGTLSGDRSGSAGYVSITTTERLVLCNEGRIETSSVGGENGGPITINGGILLVDDSHITTSVSGETGNGGDITLSPNLLVLNGGFIQANTSASQASGGDISIDTNTIIASSGNVQVGGTGAIFQPGSGINVIQAAAPDGVQGNISIAAPELDISGTLVSLASGLLEPARLSSDSCASLAEEAPSTLVQGGRGGVPAGPESSAGVTFAGYRLDRLLSTSFAPNGKVDGSVAISNGNEPDVAGNQAVLCQDGSDAGSLQYMLLH
jgi:filamentous hemagglutinin family protein